MYLFRPRDSRKELRLTYLFTCRRLRTGAKFAVSITLKKYLKMNKALFNEVKGRVSDLEQVTWL